MHKMLAVWFLALVAVIGVGGCQPTFEESGCSMDSDCFSDEYCSPARVCVIRTTSSLVISSFTPSAPIIEEGESVTLSWETRGGKSARLEGPDGFSYEIPAAQISEGSLEIESVSQTGMLTYTLTLAWDDLEKSKDVQIEVEPREIVVPVIDRFEADTTSIDPGARVTLEWRMSNTTSATITGGVTPVEIPEADLAMGSIDVNPDETTTYVLTARNGDESVESSQTITVVPLPAPTIISFEVSAMALIAGESVTLSWATMDATSISILDAENNEVFGSQDATTIASGSTTLTPTQSTSYTLTALNSVGSVQSLTFDVNIINEPVINSFTASRTADVVPGEMVELSWDVMGADSIEIEDQDGSPITSSMMATGSFMAQVQNTTTFTLIATNGAGNVSANAIVNVLVPPTITTFMADQTTSISGEAIELSWSTQDVTSLTLTDDQGSVPIIIPAGDVAAGMARVRPQVTTVYTLNAQGVGGMANSTSQDVTITVGAAPLLITEVLYAPVGMTAARQWVEVYNPGTTFVDLQHYSLGWGGSSLVDQVKSFAPYVLAPGETHVVGLTSDVGNFMPAIDLFSDFAPALEDGVGAADGVALFFSDALLLTPTSVPVDSVLWGDANSAMLLSESGMPDSEISPAVMGTSLVRVSASSDVMVDSGAGYPNTPMFVNAITPMRGPNTATDMLIIEGYGFDPMLDTVTLGTTPLICTGDIETLMCQLDLAMPSSDSGLVELRIARTQRYVQDPQGEPVLAPAMPVLTHVQQDMFFFERRELDADLTFYCGTVVPAMASTTAGMPIEVAVKLYAQGFTEGAGTLPPGWTLQAAIFDPAQAPFESFDVQWMTWQAGVNGQMDDSGNADNEIFSVELISPVARAAEAIFRVSRDPGAEGWIYCGEDALTGSDADIVSGVGVTWN